MNRASLKTLNETHKYKLPQCRICAASDARARVSDSPVHYWADYALRRVLKQGNLYSKVVKNMPNLGGGGMLEHVWVCAWGGEKPLHISRAQGSPPRDVCIKKLGLAQP